MSMTFTKLFSSITESTVWCEPDRVRLVWITMLAMADSRGRVWASIPGLANRARVPLEDAKQAIDRFLAPDEYSRTPDNDGRRIEPIDGGWRLLNHEKYRAIRDEEAIKESKRKYINTRRELERESNGVENVDRSRHNAEADTDTEKNTKRAKRVLPVDNPEGVQPQVWADWLTQRKAMRAPVTETALQGIRREAEKAGFTLEEALRECTARGWRGFKADWVKKEAKVPQTEVWKPPAKLTEAERVAADDARRRALAGIRRVA